MGLSAAFEIGKSGLRIYQVATEVVSENIANVNTPGYSRQRVNLVTAPPTTHNAFPLATGVRIASVERSYDALLQKQLVNANTTSGFDSTKSQVLQQIEPVFNEIAQDGLGAAITGFFNAWQDLATNPSGRTERQTVLGKAQVLVDQFHYTSRTLTDAIFLQDSAISPTVDQINLAISNIASLNDQIKITELSSGNANELRDRRDDLIRQLSNKIGISFYENADGTTDVSAMIGGGSYALVMGGTAAAFSTEQNTSTGKTDIYLKTAGSVMPGVKVVPDTGALGALLKTRDEIIPGYLKQIDQLAETVITSVNAQHVMGFDLGGTSGRDFFVWDISVNPPDDAARTIRLNFNDPNLIAAAEGPPAAFAAGSNGNALAIAALVDKGTMSGNTATFSVFYNSLVSQIGLDVQTANSVVGQNEAFMKQLTTLRESHSGVSLDEELTDLIKFQRAYQASAKLITTAGEMMDTIINMVR